MKTQNISPPPAHRSDATREALIQAAIVVFGRDGFDGASTRSLAKVAGVNQALIGYHFGGKEGLYLAIFEYIAAYFKARTDPLVVEMEALLQEEDEQLTAHERQGRYLPLLLRICDGLLTLMLDRKTEHWARLIVREQQQPTAAFTLLYEGFMGRVLDLQTRLVMRLRDSTDLEDARILVLANMGQLLVWRVCRAAVQHHLHREVPTEAELEKIRSRVHKNVIAMTLA